MLLPLIESSCSLRQNGTFLLLVRFFALRAKKRTTENGNYLAADHPELVEGQAKNVIRSSHRASSITEKE
jgi:hypothetical protein